MELAKRLKELRLAKDLSIKEISDLLEVPESTYRGYEYGVKMPADLVLSLSKNLKISPNDFYLYRQKQKASFEVKQAVERIRDGLNIIETCL